MDATKLPAELEDCIVLVTAHSLAIYAPSRALAERLAEPLTGRITNVLLFTPTAEEAADQDTAEEVKIASFVQMLVGIKRIGIPCGDGAAPQQGAPLSLAGNSGALMALERWPLLQAYGLDGVGRSGFFTMNFEVRTAPRPPAQTGPKGPQVPFAHNRKGPVRRGLALHTETSVGCLVQLDQR